LLRRFLNRVGDTALGCNEAAAAPRRRLAGRRCLLGTLVIATVFVRDETGIRPRLVPAADMVGEDETGSAVNQQGPERVPGAEASGCEPVVVVTIAIPEIVPEQGDVAGLARSNRPDAGRHGNHGEKPAAEASPVRAEIGPLDVGFGAEDEALAWCELVVVADLCASQGAVAMVA